MVYMAIVFIPSYSGCVLQRFGCIRDSLIRKKENPGTVMCEVPRMPGKSNVGPT